MTTFQKIAVSAALTVTIGGGLIAAKQAHDAQTQVQKLQAEQASLLEQIQKQQNVLADASNTITGLKDDFAKNQKDNSELLKLRGEIGVLRNQVALSNGQSVNSEIEDGSWQVSSLKPQPSVATKILNETKPQVRIVDSKYDHFVGSFTRPYSVNADGSENRGSDTSQCIEIGIAAKDIILKAYDATVAQTVFPSEMPAGRYDCIANLPQGSMTQLREQIKNKFGLVGERKTITTNVLALIRVNPDLPAIKKAKQPRQVDQLKTIENILENVFTELSIDTNGLPPSDSMKTIQTGVNQAVDPAKTFQRVVTHAFPIVDLTGITNRYDWDFVYSSSDNRSEDGKQKLLQALRGQLGIELIATNMPVEMLVVERVK